MARRGAGAAALGADGGQLASAQQTQGLTEAEGQAVPLAAWGGGAREVGPSGGSPHLHPPSTCTPRGATLHPPRASGLQLLLASSHLPGQGSGEPARLHSAF